MSAQLIKADLLILGRGPPIEYGAVVMDEGTIAFVGDWQTIPDEYKDISTTYVPVLMPGLWDCHVHYYGATQINIDSFVRTPQALAGARAARDVRVTLNAGYTSVRELGGYGVQLAQAIEEGGLVGPNIYSAVSPISQTAGHGDAHGTRIEEVQDAIAHGLPLCVCDGIDECIKAVRTQIRRGASVIKVMASGGVASEVDNPLDQQFSDAELSIMVEEATRTKRIVAAHCHGKDGIMAALRAGVKTIEHGTYLDEESINEMKARGAMLVATRTIAEGGLQLKDAWSEKSYAKLREVARVHKIAYKKAVTAGVKMALGSDLGSSVPNTVISHGNNGKELSYAAEAGMTPLDAIEAATANAPATLGPQAPLSGQVKEGYDADLIALSNNPIEHIDLLSNPENITHVWKAGKLYKAPESPGSWVLI
ncbi:MAG: hypothetical protein M1827_004264 [Pycnora praestabilis]|nr:MAG: hypothetical protein M1827_004264 [Pycnora praestabilis]